MTTPLPFSSDLEEELFCLFILKANTNSYWSMLPMLEEAIKSFCRNHYTLQYEDRSLAPEIFDGYVPPRAKECFQSKYIGYCTFSSSPAGSMNTKILFQFAEEE